MSQRIAMLALIGLLLLGWSGALAAQDFPEGVRVLLVDETKTFASTMRVAGLVKGLRLVGPFDVEVVLADVASSYDDPLSGKAASEPYDVILVLPRGLDDGSVRQIWIVTAGLDDLPAGVAGALDVLSGIIDQVFAGIGEAIDVSEDLWPGLLWSVYATEGWIR
jgi:hypothetical protein